jgi:hypothetical protein
LKDKKLKAFEWKSILKFLACEGEKAKAKVYRNRWLFFIPDYRKKPPYNLQEVKKAKERDQKYPLSALSFLNGSIRNPEL